MLKVRQGFLTLCTVLLISQGSAADSLKDIYAVFKEAYRPWDLASISEAGMGGLYDNVNYYIVRPSMYYNFNFKTYENNSYEIENFYPEISNTEKKLLYLMIIKLLSNHLGNFFLHLLLNILVTHNK